MNKFGGNRSIAKAKKQRTGNGFIKRPGKYSTTADSASIGSGGSAASSSSVRSHSSSTSTASTLVTTRGPSFKRPTMESLPPPCHLNCACAECTTPSTRSDFLDSLLTLAPSKPGHDSFSTLDFDASFGELGSYVF
eukprot:CAMPEP_0119006988 /NCGR_PEP_ID=MMETSP1176-20130426/2692_1 /TAXON_ID=265551 /ORGANISM="Synedropsis recta cf, Strain CCMP1620" /LENGTH=135 /DNA_ID=CAMNT_0006959037 /DNA_START=35 /DNA_END=442 /DNA_ORIENTATION=+